MYATNILNYTLIFLTALALVSFNFEFFTI